MALLFGLIGVGYLLGPEPYALWLGSLYLLGALVWVLVPWSTSIVWIDVGPDEFRVQRNGRAFAARMDDILDIEAHRHWQSSRVKDRAPAYWLKVRRINGRPWHFEYIRPGAGERVLAALYRFHKPILVYR